MTLTDVKSHFEAIAAYLDSSEQQLHDPHLLKDADKGAGILAEK